MTIKIAIIGGGNMGRQHAQYIARNPKAQLAAVCDPFTTTLAEEFGVRAFDDHRAMLEVAKPDAVIIANPNDAHVSTALDCLAVGVPMLLEKPVGTSTGEVAELVARQHATGVPILVGHHRRHNPITQQVKNILTQGELGAVTTFTAMWQSLKADNYFDVAWRRQAGAGVLLINLVHDLDLMRYFCGEVASIQALTSNDARQHEVEDTAALLLQFESGALGTLTGSDACATPWSWEQSSGENPAFAQAPEEPCYMIGGTHGSLTVPQLRMWTYGAERGWHVPLQEKRVAIPAGTALGNQLTHFIQVVRGEVAPLISVADAARTLALVESAALAARERRTVLLGAEHLGERHE